VDDAFDKKIGELTEQDLSEIAELKFRVKAMELGFKTYAPDGKHACDVIISWYGKTSKVQIKHTNVLVESKDRFQAKLAKGSKAKLPYEEHEIDFFAVYIFPHDVWYIIPWSEQEGLNACFYPHRDSCGCNEGFIEAWKLLRRDEAKIHEQ